MSVKVLDAYIYIKMCFKITCITIFTSLDTPLTQGKRR